MGKKMLPRLGSPAEKLTRLMFTRIIGAVARTLEEHDLSVAQLALLYVLDERQTLRIGDAAIELGRSLPTTSRLVDDLVRQQLVTRDEDPTDRRARVLTLTVDGRAFIAKSSQARIAMIAGALSTLPKSTIAAFLSLHDPLVNQEG